MPEIHQPEQDFALPHPKSSLASRLLVGLAAIYLTFAVVRLAWVCDDAYITFRTIDNAVHGYGLRWNISERVQTYTHPLWMLLVLVCRCVTGDVYYTALGISAVCTGIAATLIVRQGRTAAVMATGLVLLGTSRAFTTYATSGLENPLVFCLLAAFAATFLRGGDPARRLFWLSLWAALLGTTRMDTLVLVLPGLALAAWPLRWHQAAFPGVLGFLPFLAWVGFATFYYGTPFPSTAYAKAIAVDLPRVPLLREGVHFLLDVAWRDPLTALTIVSSLVLPLWGRFRQRYLPLLAGVLCYLGYILWIGGDFMALRFAAAPFVLSCFVLTDALRGARARTLWTTAVAAAGLSFLPGVPAQWNSTPVDPMLTLNGPVIDERSFYLPKLGLWSSVPRPIPDSVSGLYDFWGMRGRIFDIHGAVGDIGFIGGPRLHLIDPWLCDPLLMRLPIFDQKHWRVGHYTRRIPEGYLETLVSGRNQLHHPALREYYEHLRLVTEGPLWSWERIATAAGLLVGQHQHLLRQYVEEEYRNPPLQTVQASELTPPDHLPAHWFDTPCRLINEGGLAIRFPGPQSGHAVTLHLDAGDAYSVQFRVGEQVLFETTQMVGDLDHYYEGLRPLRLDLPAAATGFDNILLSHAIDPKAANFLLSQPQAETMNSFQASALKRGTTNDSIWAFAGIRVE
jgi:arabinofuranosyltransferase